ncbi:unnamed protein product [Rotaria sordida]|uniref:EGF-like domain-containing protein n=1 Tax=Rotaria sordida TaxID=392033 RepID=A0A815MZW3_9BILA|nr:unnamed protein product [Rotaria sordida]
MVPDLCYNGGDCYLLDNGTFACDCPPTFTGLFCETEPLSACANYCHNEGHCNVTTGNSVPRCYCKPPWSGPRCKTLNETAANVEPKECTNLPGGNYCNRPNGSCDFINGKVICRCRPTHTGRRCETQLGQPPLTSTQPPMTSQSTTSSGDTMRPPTTSPLTHPSSAVRCTHIG